MADEVAPLAAVPPDQAPPPTEADWVGLPDDRLLDLRLCDLGVTIEGSKIAPRVEQLYQELDARRLTFRPHVWLSDEWFTPDGVGGIAVPFYLAHPRLERLEESQMLEVEGGTPDWCMRILRHEAGHAIENAFHIQRRRKRLQIFGNPADPYPDHYLPRPYSKSFVLHLDSWYAQSHPAEDFAETFAVWLSPADWRARYADWPALRKLEYMDHLMRELAGQQPANASRRRVDPIGRLKRTLRQHYQRKRAHYGVEHPDFYDRDLRRLFTSGPESAGNMTAARFIGRIRKDVRRRIAAWTGQYQYTIDQVLEDMIARCRQLGLRLKRSEEETRYDFFVLLTVQTMNYLHSGRHRTRSLKESASVPPRKAPSRPAHKLRVVVLMHHYLVPPEDTSSHDLATVDWKTEYDVASTLVDMGHEVIKVGVKDDLGVIRDAVTGHKPHIVFNLLENFHEVGVFDAHVVSYLELLRVPYTGCNPRGLMLSRDKALSKTLMSYHRIPAPEFAIFRVGRSIQRPKRLAFPLFVKSLTQDASIGISQASVVHDDEKLRERVHFIHQRIGTDAIVERYVEGRELYVGVLGNLRLEVLPVWELEFNKMPEDVHRIATERVKWSPKYQKKHGITTGAARDLPEGLAERVQHIARRVYRTLELSGYARIDLRLDDQGRVSVLEANANPQLAYGEDLADSAEQAGISYEALLQKIINSGLRWRPDRLG